MNSQVASGLLFAEGKYQVRRGDRTASCSCRITFDLGRDGTLHIDCLDPLPLEFQNEDHKPFFVELPYVQQPVECFAVRSRTQFGEQSGFFVSLMARHSLVTVDHGRGLSRVNAAIANLGHYIIRMPSNTHFVLEADNWKFNFTAVSELTFLYPQTGQSEDYFFTHHLVLERSDGAEFCASDAEEQLEIISLFLSFCHEHWVSPTLVAGVDKSGVVSMEQWGTRMLSKWSRGQNWLDEHHGSAMLDVFPGFVQRLRDPFWKEIIRRTLYWYVRANTAHVGPDGAVILLQAALETLSWHVLVRDRHALSEAGFTRLTAADQLRLLLNVATISTEIPKSLTELALAAKKAQWADGPEAFVGIRNRLVHPPKKASSNSKLPYYEAYQLGKWYLELALLRNFEYKGPYSNRTKQSRYVGDVEPVPWAESSPRP